jgi:hypothetical protein
MHLRILVLALATTVVSSVGFAQTIDRPVGGPFDAFQIDYASNLNLGDSYVNITNAGTVNGADPLGEICANVYTFDPAEELISCCTCLVTPNGLDSLSDQTDLISNTLTPGVPTSIVIKLVATFPVAGVCNAGNGGFPFAAGQLAPGMRAWGTTLHNNAAAGVVALTENVFQDAVLSNTEDFKLASYCNFIQADGSGFGICKSCATGGLGASKK